MSLIQKALEKANRLQTTTTSPKRSAGVPQHPAIEPVMGDNLENELRAIQMRYSKKQKTWLPVFLAVLTFSIIVGLFFLIASRSSKMPESSAKHISKKNQQSFATSIFRVNGITKADGQFSAVINDEIVMIGDWISKDAVVTDIDAQAVTLDVRGKKIQLKL